jgi:hypothetical protein
VTSEFVVESIDEVLVASAEPNLEGASAKKKRTRTEMGYIMTMMVIMLPLLLSFMALAVDATYYWFRGVQIQRAADAAALAGVTRMPKYNEAVNAGNDIAKRNGFVDGEDDMVVTPSRIPKNNKRFKITITDNSVGIFFGRVISNGWSISRSSTAEYISNIPLGSKENAIGTGYLSDSGPDLQNFWLAASGPCAPKEWGDQFLSRWDGNAVNKYDSSVAQANPLNDPTITATNVERQFSALCDVDPNPIPAANLTGVGYIRPQITTKNAAQPALPKLFPAVVQNLDYNVGKSGYDYIIDVPCYHPTATPVPPPCDATNMPGDLIIQVYDPVFNPDSIQRFAQRVNPIPSQTPPRGDTSGFTNEVDDRLKPDKYGLYRPEITECYAIAGVPPAAPTPSPGCVPADTGPGNPKPSDVRVTTDVRIFPPDNSPLDYSDDVAIDLTGATTTNTVDVPDKFVLDSEATLTNKKVRRFGSCMKWTDEWTSYTAGGTPGSHFFYSVPPSGSATPVYGTPDVTTWNPAVEPTKTGLDVPTECAKYMSQWVTIKRISATNRRGRYRLNLRTIDATNSFGSNGFAIRAFFVSPATPSDAETYPTCLKDGTPVCTNPEQIASVAGDSTMSVFASVNNVSRFYLAQLSPSKLFRNKVVVVSLWDPGEGAAKLQILRPEATSATCDATLIDTATYCIQPFQWTVGRPGIAAFNATDPFAGLSSGTDYQDVCIDKGLPGSAPGLPTFLAVAHPTGVTDGTAVDSCSAVQPNEIKRSRQFKEDKSEQKFNDRLVTVAIKVPENYGCQAGTGVVDPVTGNPVTCIDLEDAGIGLPEGGWWKIKYTPRLNVDPISGAEIAGSYKKITDRTTWSVGLRGDPVHLVPNGQ